MFPQLLQGSLNQPHRSFEILSYPTQKQGPIPEITDLGGLLVKPGVCASPVILKVGQMWGWGEGDSEVMGDLKSLPSEDG